MIIKGIISSIDEQNRMVEVILPEYQNVVTKPLNVYHTIKFDTLSVNDFVLVVIFNNDFNDGIVI